MTQVWARLGHWLENQKLKADFLLLDAFLTVSYRSQMAYLQKADHRHPDSPGYKSMRMARFWAACLLILRRLQRGAWKSRAQSPSTLRFSFWSKIEQIIPMCNVVWVGDDVFAAYVNHATTKLTVEERELSFLQADEMLKKGLRTTELKAQPWLERSIFYALHDTTAFAKAVSRLMVAVALDEAGTLVSSDLVSPCGTTIRIFSGEEVKLTALMDIVVEHAGACNVEDWPEFGEEEDGAFVLMLTQWHNGDVPDSEAIELLRGYGLKYIVMHPDNQYANERQVKEAQAQRTNHANSSQELICAKHMSTVNCARKALYEVMNSAAMKARTLSQNQHVQRGSAETRKRQGAETEDKPAAPPPYCSRWRFSKLAALLYLDKLKRRGEESARLWTKSNLRAAEPQGAAFVSAAESRRARVVAGFTAKLWEVRHGRSRALFEHQPKPTMQPVVAPGLTNEYSVGSYNSRMKVVAELDARGVAYDNKDPFRSTEEGVVSLVQRLKALPDVFKSTVDGKLYLKRKGPNWDDPETDGDAAELELLETTMAGRGV